MARKHGSKAIIKLDNAGGVLTDISQYVTSVTQPREADTADVSGLGDTARSFVAGLKTGTISFEGNFDPTVDAIFRAALGVETKTVEYGPQGGTAGLPRATAEVIITSYEVSTDLGDAGKFSAEGQITGAITDDTYA